jgi:hypothetical protein
MSYNHGLADTNAVTIKDYARCNSIIENATLIRFLRQAGYDIINCSIFDLQDNPSLVDESLLPIKTKLISDRTLLYRIRRDLGWLLIKHLPLKHTYSHYLEDNHKFLDLVHRRARINNTIPEFIYAHFTMPHPPYFYDKDGNRRSDTKVYSELGNSNPPAYLGYLQYTNTEIQNLVNNIQQNDSGAVIIIMGDHGYRYSNGTQEGTEYNFRNINAVYLPGNKQSQLYDSISGVNQFRVVLNHLFALELPLLKDSTVFLKDIKPK